MSDEHHTRSSLLGAFFAPTIILTAIWQGQLVKSSGLHKGMGQQAITFSICSGSSVFLVAVVPITNAITGALHILTATLVQAFGDMYGIQAMKIAGEVFENNGLYVIRLVLLMGCAVAGVVSAMVMPKAMGTARGLSVEGRTDVHVRNARRWMLAGATGQMTLGAC